MPLLYNDIALIRPNINYLDVISKLMSRGSKVFEIETSFYNNQFITRFKHSIDKDFSTFQEELSYNKYNELTYWKTIINNEEFVIYDESLFI